VIDEVFHLKNSVAKHRPAEEFAAIRSRIARTKTIEDSVATGAVRVSKGCRVSSAVAAVGVTFAEHAVEGFEVPWTSNPVQLTLMGEVSKRCRTSGCAGQQRIGSDTPTSVGEVRRPESTTKRSSTNCSNVRQNSNQL